MILLLKVLMLFSLQRLPLFAFLLLRSLVSLTNAFLPKGLFGSLNDSTEQIVLQPHGTNSRRSYHSIEVFSTQSIFFVIDFVKSSSSSKSKWGYFSRLLYKNSPPLFFPNLFKDTCLTTFFLEMIIQFFLFLLNSVMPLLITFPRQPLELTNLITSMSSSTFFDLIPTRIFKELSSFSIHLFVSFYLSFYFKKSFIIPIIERFSLDPFLLTI